MKSKQVLVNFEDALSLIIKCVIDNGDEFTEILFGKENGSVNEVYVSCDKCIIHWQTSLHGLRIDSFKSTVTTYDVMQFYRVMKDQDKYLDELMRTEILKKKESNNSSTTMIDGKSIYYLKGSPDA